MLSRHCAMHTQNNWQAMSPLKASTTAGPWQDNRHNFSHWQWQEKGSFENCHILRSFKLEIYQKQYLTLALMTSLKMAVILQREYRRTFLLEKYPREETVIEWNRHGWLTYQCRRSHHPAPRRHSGSIRADSADSFGHGCCAYSLHRSQCLRSLCSYSDLSGHSIHSLL